MSEEKSQEAFLGRWSRLKQQKAQEDAKPAPVEEARPEPPAPLPAIEDLKPDSDFKPFMDPRVDAGTRRLALKKLFADAHFNTVDPFEPYSIDLTGEDPISPEMMKTLDHAKRLFFEEKEAKEAVAEAGAEESGAETPLQSEEPTDVAGKQDA